MDTALKISNLAEDTLKGLSADPKYLLPKYFYDDAGSRIFQDIMNMPEYYLTDCESEIFKSQKREICTMLMQGGEPFDLIELGSGDGSKTKIVLRQLVEANADFSYQPIDISAGANEALQLILENELPQLNLDPHTGDYFEVLEELDSTKRKVIFFLGSNIGNFSQQETDTFLTRLANCTQPGDQVLVGFDLKKSPEIIMRAYDDPHGHTRRFNLNLLKRLNKELDADFNLNAFVHHTTYNPVSGDVKSYLVSTRDQTVRAEALAEEFRFAQWEAIFMERSHKFDPDELQRLAAFHGFEIKQNFYDSCTYFVDSLWVRR